MLKNLVLLLVVLMSTKSLSQLVEDDMVVNQFLNDWHQAAADADFDAYFGKMTDDAVFIGTDATENWQNKAFRQFSKPYFDKGKAWSFSVLDRHIYISGDGTFAWFDELLDTQMKICRGSGVLKKQYGQWKIAHYVLSLTVPNEHVPELIKIKKEKDSLLMQKFRRGH